MDEASSRLERQAAVRAGLVLQRLPLGRDLALRPLYLRAPPGLFPLQARVEADTLHLAPGAEVSFDTYFGAFFEPAWRGPTTLGRLCLDVEGSGRAVLRLFRRDMEGQDNLLHEAVTRLDAGATVEVPAPLGIAAAGRLHVSVEAGAEGCSITSLAWRAPDAAAAEVALVPVFCTFGREQQLAEVLAAIAAEPEVWQALPRVVVVNQGKPGLASHPAFDALPEAFRARLEVIDQGNFGGAGGFTRGLLAAQEVPGATHAVLMDDDVVAEPEALRRTAAFFAIARGRCALGGHMLDQHEPTRLFEAGASLDRPRLGLQPLHYRTRLVPREGLDALTRPVPPDYNGWWYFALPLALLDEVGLPMPCFIRGDDVEFGLRLQGRGIPTFGVPGVAIWHEPFYMKLHGWHGYYEWRNALVFGSLHLPRRAYALALLVANRLVGQLLAHRYHDAALTLRAAEDWLRGPEIFEVPPADLHAEIQALRAAHPVGTLPHGLPAADLPVAADPRGRLHHGLRMARALLHAALARDTTAPARRLPGEHFVWFRMVGGDHVAVDTGWEAALPTFRRSRATFRRQFHQGARVVRRILLDGDAVTADWQAAAPRFTSRAEWERRLGLGA